MDIGHDPMSAAQRIAQSVERRMRHAADVEGKAGSLPFPGNFGAGLLEDGVFFARIHDCLERIAYVGLRSGGQNHGGHSERVPERE